MAVYILNRYIIVFINHHRLGLCTSFYQFALKLLKPPSRVPRQHIYDSKRKSHHISNILLGNLLNYVSRFIAYKFCIPSNSRTQFSQVVCHFVIIRISFPQVSNNMIFIFFLKSQQKLIYFPWAICFLFVGWDIYTHTHIYIFSKIIEAFSTIFPTTNELLSFITFNIHISTNSLW